MKLTYFVNAMMLLEGADTRVLCDPWVTLDTKSTTGLYNFPETRFTPESIAALKPDYIYITHTHADHFDPPTLEYFDKSTPVLVSHYEHNFTANAVRNVGFTDVRISDPVNGLKLNGDDHCWIEPSAVYSAVDSVGLFRIDGQTVLNINDNPYHESQFSEIRQRFGPVDLGCIPYSYLGPYPAFYENISDEEKLAEAKAKKARNLDNLVKFIKTLEPKRVLLIAAEAIYGGKKALMYPYYGVCSPAEALEYARERCDFDPVVISEGCSVDLETGNIEGTAEERNYESEADYVRRISEIPGPFEEGGVFFVAPSQRVDLTRQLAAARRNQRRWQERTGTRTQAVYFIDVGGDELYRLCMADDTVSKVREVDIADEAFEIFRMPYSLMIALLTRHYNYSNVKTQHMTFYRKPNVYDPDLHILMSYLQC